LGPNKLNKLTSHKLTSQVRFQTSSHFFSFDKLTSSQVHK
jgi:hypothetical protein